MTSRDFPRTLEAMSRGLDRFLAPLLVFSGLLLVVGWVLPVITIKTLIVFRDEFSILGGGLELWQSGEYLLCILIMIFTVLFPTAKLGLAYLAWSNLHAADPRLHRALGWIETLGKWSMLDVFVIALLVVILKISLISDVTVHLGLYVFAAAVILSMLVVKRIAYLAHRAVWGPSGRPLAPPRTE